MSSHLASTRHSPLATRHSEAEDAAVVRPRTAGELLDDAWRLYLADAPALLLLTSLFLAPAFAALLLLTDLPTAANSGLPGPAYTALWLLAPLPLLALLVLSGLGSGACQEWFRARAEGRKAATGACLAAAFRRWTPHLTARALALLGPMLGLGVWLFFVSDTEKSGRTADAGLLLWRLLLIAVACLPGLLVWPVLATLHAFIASGKLRSSADLMEHFRLAGSETGKGGVVTMSRAALLVMAAVNLMLLVVCGLWILDGMAGLDAAFIGMQLTLANPVYDLALVLLAWLLLAPFFEACNFLLHVDARSRHEGLDLQLRVQRVFPTAERKRVGALAVLIGALWLAAAPARADSTYDAVHAARLDVQRIAQEAARNDPYDGSRWQKALDGTAERLEHAGVVAHWLREEIDGKIVNGKPFAVRPKEDALKVLSAIDDRLGLLEETYPHEEGSPQSVSKDDLKNRLEQSGGHRPVVRPQNETNQKPADDEKDQKDQKDEKKPDDQKKADEKGGGTTTASLPSCGPTLLMLMCGLALAVVVVGAVKFIANRKRASEVVKGPALPSKAVRRTAEVHEPAPTERSAAELWREADDLARKEEYREAVRTLYLAVLSLLHGRQLLRYERTRTNGEYVQQVRLAPQAPPALHTVFQGFTNFFESKWYGDPTCDGAEYRAARKSAEEIQTLVREL